jgi:hypothetical protein
MAVFEVLDCLVRVESFVDDPTGFVDFGKTLLQQLAAEVISDGSVLRTLLPEFSQKGKSIRVNDLVKVAV